MLNSFISHTWAGLRLTPPFSFPVQTQVGHTAESSETENSSATVHFSWQISLGFSEEIFAAPLFWHSYLVRNYSPHTHTETTYSCSAVKLTYLEGRDMEKRENFDLSLVPPWGNLTCQEII